MGFRDTLSSKIAPVFFRLALGATFVWAGYGKVFTKASFTPDDLASLANMGVNGAIAAARPTTSPAPVEQPKPVAPARPSDPDAPLPEPSSSGGALASTTSVAGRHFTPSDFETNVSLTSLHRLSLLIISSAADPQPRADGSKPLRLWPRSLGQGAWPARLAWTVALTEFVGGCLILIGFLARLASIGIFGTMLGALWLATFGPAINSQKAFLYILPELSAFQPWQSFALQMCALACAFGVFALGAGWLSVDAFVFSSSKPAPADHDDE